MTVSGNKEYANHRCKPTKKDKLYRIMYFSIFCILGGGVGFVLRQLWDFTFRRFFA